MQTLNTRRRDIIKMGALAGLAAVGGSWVLPGRVEAAAAWNQNAFEAKTIADVIKAMGGAEAIESDQIVINGPDIAENGAVVPVGASSKLPKTEQIAILVEKNPAPLAASFDILDSTGADVSTRVKMGGTSDVYALVKADGKFYIAKKEIKVTLGGCGG